MLIVEVLANKLTNFIQCSPRLANQIFEVDLKVVAFQLASVAAPFRYHPVPVESGSHFRWRSIPWQAPNISLLVSGKRYVAAVTNDVNDERFGNSVFDAVQI